MTCAVAARLYCGCLVLSPSNWTRRAAVVTARSLAAFPQPPSAVPTLPVLARVPSQPFGRTFAIGEACL